MVDLAGPNGDKLSVPFSGASKAVLGVYEPDDADLLGAMASMMPVQSPRRMIVVDEGQDVSPTNLKS